MFTAITAVYLQGYVPKLRRICHLLHYLHLNERDRARCFVKMEKTEYRAVIKYFVIKGMKATEIRNELQGTLGESAPSFATISRWVNAFTRGRTGCVDEPRPGPPKTVTTNEMVLKIHTILMQDRRLKVREIADMVNISTERVHHILTEELGLSKLSARWVPRLLTADQKCNRLRIANECLDLYKRNPADFLRRFVTCDETWIHHSTPETKQQSKQWLERGSAPPKKAKSILSANKVMASVFWDAKGILLIDYLQKGATINGQYYAELLQKLNDALRAKRPGMAKKKVLFHQDNAPAHTSTVAMSKIHDLHFQLVPHAPYSPDMAPSDYHLFPKLKTALGGKKFSSNDEVITFVNQYFEDLPESHFKNGITALEHRWEKCISLCGEYIEK